MDFAVKDSLCSLRCLLDGRCITFVTKSSRPRCPILYATETWTRQTWAQSPACLPFFYGISKLVIDITSNILSGKLLVSLGLVSSGVCCVLFPCFSNVLVLTVLWGLHGCMQALGWPGCANLLKSWYGPNEIATWWSILTASGNIGGIATPLVVANIAFYWGWGVHSILLALWLALQHCCYGY